VNNTLQARIVSRLEREPDARAITFLDNRGRHEWIAAGTFFDDAAKCATFLSESGLSKGGVCVIVLSSGDIASKAVLACVLLGAAPLLVAPPSIQTAGAFSSLSQILRGVIKRIRPAIVILESSLLESESDLASVGEGSETRILAGNDIDISGPKWRLRTPLVEGDLAALQLTSGTTGFPKICRWRQDAVVAAIDGMADAMRVTPQDIFLNWTPLYHDMGLVNNFLLCMALGVPLGMMRPQDFVKDPSLWLRGLDTLRATVTWSPNFGFALAAQRVRDEDIAGVQLGHVRGFWSAAERIHYETMVAFYERFKSLGVRREALKTNFGCAENIGGATFSDPDGAFRFERLDRTAFFRERIARPADETTRAQPPLIVVGAGKGHPQLQVRIVSEDRQPLPDGHIGEIALVTPSRMEEYIGDPEATAHAIVDDLLVTGDLGYLRSDELFWVGRVQERINVRGVKMDPSDFEPALHAIQGLRPGCFAAFGVDDTIRGTQRIVIVTEVKSATNRTGDEFKSDVRRHVFLALGVNVDDVLLVREGTLTKTSSGKRRHQYVKNLYEGGELVEYLWNGPVQTGVRG
jgi:acyl-CoA synthetase (AMP-forming)/AMP-acid ligase II